MNLSKDITCICLKKGSKPTTAWVNMRFIGRQLTKPFRLRRGKYTFINIIDGVKLKVKSSIVNNYIKYAKEEK